MAKRLTDTDKWRKPFIKKLPIEYKLLWFYILDDCEHCGIWQVDFEVASIRLNCEYSEDEAVKYFSEKIIVIDDGTKWFIPDFVRFQYGEQLVIANRMHKPVIDKLQRLNLLQYINCDIVQQGTTANAIRSRVTQKVKDRIFLRDEFTCQYCSVQHPKEALVIDHILPINKGGDSEDDNLCASCERCNRYKSDFLLPDFLSKGHQFVHTTDRVNKLLQGALASLYAPSKNLEGAKDKEQEQYKDKDIGGVGDFLPNSNFAMKPKQAPDFQDVHEFFVRQGKTEAEARRFYDYHDGLGWMKGVTPIVNWTAFASKWISSPLPSSKYEPPKEDPEKIRERQIALARKNAG